ncbi:uncharacterized protein LOC135705734 [Ochlerotatus camptorhynchus]|uniref:uncharacterized protein LOC135705734 n=1 Tax=Ochlerotatus camptorhynchus TaxID=644619 RepID=UPI0031DCBF65
MFRLVQRFRIRNYCTQSGTSQLVNSLASSIDGLEKETLTKLFQSAPQLAKYVPELWHRTYNLMAQEGIDTANFLSIVTGYPEVLTRHPDRLTSSMHCWRSCQFGDRQMQVLLAAHPQLFDFTDHNQLAQRVAFLHSYFETRKNVWRLFLNCPNLVVDKEGDIRPKIDYVLQTMRIEVLEVVKSCAFVADLDLIRCRHVFLERLGLFKPRSLKAEPGDPSSNPKLHQITDTTDKRFAVKVAFVTLEEYEAFVELYRKERDRFGEGTGDLDEEDDEYDFDDAADEGRQERKQKYRKKTRRNNSGR